MSKNNVDINKLTADLKAKYPDAGIRSIEVDENKGTSTFMLTPTQKNLAFLDKPGAAVKPHVYKESASTTTRDYLTRQVLDLALSQSPYDQDVKDLYTTADQYYYTDPLLGSTINILASLAMKGFENDIDDANIKQFYDTWAFDVNFDEVLEWIFLDFFKIGHVTTYKVLGAYTPRVSNISPAPGQSISTPTDNTATAKELDRIKKLHAKYEQEAAKERSMFLKEAASKGASASELKALETAAKKNIWSKGHLPISYTVLNPQYVTIEGNLLFDTVSVTLTPPSELSTLLKKNTSELTDDEKTLIKSLPTDLKNAATSGGDYKLDSRLVGSVTYRKQPYERYARPRSTRLFETINYKQKLKDADISTLDGISNYILKITVGNDTYPVTTQTELETVASLFDTPSKSFDVVWNHTLQVEKIVSPEIESILGQDKYKQVNDDMTAGLAVTRAIIDGSGNIGSGEITLLIKGLTEEINYARRQVAKWIYREYRQIAEAMGFDRFPKVRWDEGVLKDTILYMNTLASLVDRRMLSYRTALEALGFDYDNELRNMQDELPLVTGGTFGITGSPFQQSGTKLQDTQNAPEGTPSNGRPTGQTNTKTTNTDVNNQPDQKVNTTTKSTTTASNVDPNSIKFLTTTQLKEFYSGAKKELTDEQFLDFVCMVEEIRSN